VSHRAADHSRPGGTPGPPCRQPRPQPFRICWSPTAPASPPSPARTRRSRSWRWRCAVATTCSNSCAPTAS